jgi:ABC-type uncharacterized transport system permease subunit
MSAGIVFHLLAALVYAGLAIMLWRKVDRGDKTAQPLKANRIGLGLAIVLHAIGLSQAMLPANSLVIGWALALSAAIWLGMIIFWLENLVLRLDGLLLILLPAATLAALLAAISPHGYIVAHPQNEWLRIHLLIALTAYGLITVAALHAILMAALDRQLHRPIEPEATRSVLGRALESMPPLLVQEHLLFRLLWLGFSVLTLTVVTGAIVSLTISGVLFPLDHKTVFTLLSWIIFGVLLLGRHLRGWRGRLALRWTLAGFAFLMLAYTGSHFVIDVILQRG